MTYILTPASIWMQLANFFFLLSGMFWDLLIIRICLCAAYVWILTAASLGYPLWPNDEINPGGISLDGVLWAVVNLVVHLVATVRLLWDERPIKFHNALQEQLWLFFYRRSGMGKLEFLETYKRCRIKRFKAGDEICSPVSAHRTFFLVIDGKVDWDMQWAKEAEPEQKTQFYRDRRQPMVSGDCFDKGLLNVLGCFVAFETNKDKLITVTAEADVLLAMWDLEDLNYLASGAGPAVAAYWRNFTLCQLGIESLAKEAGGVLVNARSQPEPPGVQAGTQRSTDFTDPLSTLEDPPATWNHALMWLPARFGPFVPLGIRHQALPVHGLQAKNRVTAILKASGRATVSEGEMLKLMDSPSRYFWERAGLTHRNPSAPGVGSVVKDVQMGRSTAKELDHQVHPESDAKASPTADKV